MRLLPIYLPLSKDRQIDKLPAGFKLNYTLNERYTTQRPSATDDYSQNPLSLITTEITQSLITAPSIHCTVSNGLLMYRDRPLYETNTNNSYVIRRLLNPKCSIPPGALDKKTKPKLVEEDLLLVSTFNNPNYYHWLFSPGTSSIFLWYQHSGLLKEPPTFLLSDRSTKPSLPTYVQQVIKLVTPQASILQTTDSLRCPKLLFSYQHNHTKVSISPRQVKWIRSIAMKELTPVPKQYRRLFITRSKATRRRCLNENELMRHISQYNFELVSNEDLDLLDQMKLFATADVIIGSHGAGLSNIISCKPNTIVIELFPDNIDLTTHCHYYLISDILGIKHAHLTGKTMSKTDDFLISPSALLSLLKHLNIK